MNTSELDQYASETAIPRADALINTFRAYGYNLQTAIADIIDNSITANANAVWINFQWEGKDSTISILDNGHGMDLPNLIAAMTPGSKNPDHDRSHNDLGRFGLGLKTASFSQCKRLTVATKSQDAELIKRCWDLDYVNESQNWKLLNYISAEHHLKGIGALKSGTLVLWENLDRLVGNSRKENEVVLSVFLDEFDKVEQHLGLVFHRYLEKKKLQIWLNGNPVKAWDPFLKSEKNTYIRGQERLGNGKVNIKCYILPHLSALDEVGRRTGGGPNGWYDQQGFYIYREERLIVPGSWLGLFPKNEHSKLARICVDFPNDLDHDWKLDIKKSTASPPPNLQKDLMRLGLLARAESGAVYKHRGTRLGRNPELPDFQMKPIWESIQKRDGPIVYQINREHPLIALMLKKECVDKADFRRLLSLVETSIPIETIIHFQSENPTLHELREPYKEMDNATLQLAKKIYDSLIIAGTSREIAIKQILALEPFNHFPELAEYLN